MGLLSLTFCVSVLLHAQTENQPKVTPGPNEPNWWDVLETVYGLDMREDLVNPVHTTPEQVAGLFRKATPGTVVFEPIIALGTETVTRGGWYTIIEPGSQPETRSLWSYQFKNGPEEIASGKVGKPPLLRDSKVEFDPGERAFGLWISNDSFDDGGVFSQPQIVRRINRRLAEQPYKVMIYPLPKKPGGEPVPHAYLMGWEYSTNDDFQDVVCVIKNVDLVP